MTSKHVGKAQKPVAPEIDHEAAARQTPDPATHVAPPDAADAVPKGMPTSDRFHMENSHARAAERKPGAGSGQ